MFEGSLVALITPFREGKVDTDALRGLTDRLVEAGANAIVPCGTTGESATLDDRERADVIRAVVDTVAKRVPVVAGTGYNDTRSTIETTKMAAELGVDGVLLVAPYYNKPPQEGLYLHYEAVSRAVDVPQVVYNVPGRCVVNIDPETVARLSRLSNIVAIKDASGSLEQMTRIRELCDIDVLSGDDALTVAMMKQGAKGVISVAANIIPDQVAALAAAAKAGDEKKAEELDVKWHDLFQGLFIESNPIPVKAAAAMMGWIPSDEMRLPLCRISDDAREKLKALLSKYGLV